MPASSPTPELSERARLALSLVSRLDQSDAARIAAARIQKLSAERDLSIVGDPAKLSREDLLAEILYPALKARWLRIKHERDFWKRVDGLSDDQLRDWATEVLKAHPWPPGWHVPSFVEFVTSPDYLDDAAPTERQRRVFEETLGPDAYHWFVHPRKINLLVLMWGKGSGKDWLSACILAYVTYCIWHMRNPWFHFGTITGEVMDCINVAESAKQAKDVFFAKLERMLQQPCFEPILDQRPKYGDIKAEIVTFRKAAAGRRHKPLALRILSLNSQSESVEGKNTLFWVMDEADAFRTAEGHANAREMFEKLSSSNRFADQQIGIIISYPRARNGFMFAMLKRCGNKDGDMKNWWGDKAATYEVLPFKTFIPTGHKQTFPDPLNPGQIIEREVWTNPTGYTNTRPDTVIAGFYANDPETYQARYCCNPQASEDAFISRPERIDEAVKAAQDAGQRPVAEVETFVNEVRHANGDRFRYVAKRLRNLQLRPGITYFLGGDAGVRQDSFALSLCHIVPPGEQGYCCPVCWTESRKRLAKHYAPEPVPEGEEARGWNRQEWACDHCGALPRDEHLFWGVARLSGQVIERPIVKSVSKDGTETYEEEEVEERDETGRVRRVTRVKTEKIHMPLVVEDLLIEWQPDRMQSLEVDFQNVTELIVQLAKTGQVGHARFDQWQAEEKVQQLRKAGISAGTKQLSNPEQLRMYKILKDLLYSHLLWLLPGQPRRDTQLRELQLVRGIKVDHPQESEDGSRGGKDLTDALAIAVALCVDFHGSLGTIYTGRGGKAGRVMREQGKKGKEERIRRGSIVGQALAGRLSTR